MTYMIALRLKFTPQQAATIAAADWSMDLNRNTEAKPSLMQLAAGTAGSADPYYYDPDQAQMIRNFYAYPQRGGAYHSLGNTPQEIEGRLNVIRSTISGDNDSQWSDAKLVQLGQYLHATQDTYFHQQNGKPLDTITGHLYQGERYDYVAERYDAALRSNQATYDILKQYAKDGTLPAVRPASEIYTTDTKAELKTIVGNNSETGVSSLTAAIGRSYKIMPLEEPVTVTWNKLANAMSPGSRATGIDIGAANGPDPDDLRKNLSANWQKFGPKGVPYDPKLLPQEMLDMDRNSKVGPNGKRFYDYDGDDAKLLMPKAAPADPGRQSGISAGDPAAGALPSGTTAAGAMPGGISLSFAAARRMTIDINLDGADSADGRIILSGQSGGKQRVDAALFQTALRLACGPNDPYFSLDADDGKAWTEEGRNASEQIWQRIRADYGIDDPLKKGGTEGLVVRSLSAKRDYAQLWSTLSPRYPNLKTRLVFNPEWLRFTRFGEILYKADVLLKELDGGVPTLQFDRDLRARSVGRYASATARSAAESLLRVVSGEKTNAARDFRGSRLWFDLAPKANDNTPGISLLDDTPPQSIPAVARPSDPTTAKVLASLATEGYVGKPRALEPARTLAVDGGVVDLSQVYPKMFVRAHDTVTNKDVPGSSPTLNALSEDVNGRIKQYVEAYDELRELTEIFRLYVAAVAFTRKDPRICPSVEATPLLRSERLTGSLPEFHASELYFVFATYVQSGPNGKKSWWFGSSGSHDGGVSPRGKEYFEREAALVEQTAITKAVTEDVSNRKPGQEVWRGPSGRDNVALAVDMSPRYIREAERLKNFRPVRREEVLASLGVDDDTISGGIGLLDQGASAVTGGTPGKASGMLDDVDPNARGIQRIPARP
jgi:hypothetical protein